MKVIFFWGHWNGDRSKIDELCGIYGKDEMLQKSNLIFFIRSFYNCHHTTYLSFWLQWQVSFKRNFAWTFYITNYSSKKNRHNVITSIYFWYFNFEILSILGDKLSGFLFSSDIEMTIFSDRKNYYISHFMGGQILFSQVGFFFISVKDCHQGNYKNVKRCFMKMLRAERRRDFNFDVWHASHSS